MENEKMAILLIMPRYIINDGDWYTFPLGLPYISSYLKSMDLEVHTLNLNHIKKNEEEVIREVIKSNNIKIVGVSISHIIFDHCYKILDIVKSIDKNITTIIGGGVVSGTPKDSLIAYKNADIGIIGEGEYTFYNIYEALIHNKNLTDITGIVYRVEDGIVLNPECDDINDISKLPWPDYDGFDFSKTLNAQARDGHIISNILPILSSRSCPFNCSFCFHTCGRKYRVRDLDDFFSELEYSLSKYDITLVVIYDELLTSNRVRLEEFCKRIKKYNVNWACSLRVDGLNEEILEIMKNANCINASFGVEHISDTILQSMEKHITKQQIEAGLEILYNHNFAIDSNILFGDIAENLESVKEAKQWLLENRKYGLNVCGILTLPGSKIFNFAVDKKIIPDVSKYLSEGEFAIKLTQVSDDEYSELIKIIDSIDDEYYYYPTNYALSKNSGETCNITAVCTKCNNLFKSPNFPLNEKIKIICPNCHQSYIIKPFEEFFCREKCNEILKKAEKVALIGRTYVSKIVGDYLIEKFPNIELYILDYSNSTCNIPFYDINTYHISVVKNMDFDLVISCVSKPELLDLCEHYYIKNLISSECLVK